MLVLLLGAELTSSFPPSQDPEPDSRQDFIFAYYNGGQMGDGQMVHGIRLSVDCAPQSAEY